MSKKNTSKKKNKNIAKAEIRVQALPNDLRNEIGAKDGTELYGVTIDDIFLRTPENTLIAHEDIRAMRELAAELDYSDEVDAAKINLYGLYSTKIEFVDKGRQEFDVDFLTWILLNDPVFKPCAGPEFVDQMKYLKLVVDYIESNGLEYLNLPQIPIEEESLREWLGEERAKEFLIRLRPLLEFVQSSIQKLSNYQMSVFLTTAHVFDSPMLGIMLANQLLTANEFAVIYLTTLAINSKIWGETDRQEERALLETYTKQAECMLRFIDQFTPKLSEVEKIILAKEGGEVEFKSTLRWNIDERRKDPVIEHEVLKTIAAFLNTNGGTLLVGVDDKGCVLGIDLDRFEDEDKYLLYFSSLVNNHIGRQFIGFVPYELESAQGMKFLKVSCKKSPTPIILKNNGVEEFFIRSGPSSVQLKLPREIVEYTRVRFPNL